MIPLFKKFFRPKYTPLNRIEILSQNILHNVSVLKKQQKQAEIVPVIKSNAYGHGIEEICSILGKSAVKMLAVDSFPEAQKVYKYSSKKVLLIGESALDCYEFFDVKRTEFCVYNIETFKKLASFKKNISVHLFINTGMNREGIQDLEIFLENTKEEQKHINIIGVCSHLASADSESDLNKEQEKIFFENVNILKSHNISPKYVHLGNSAGTFLLKNKKLNLFRTGISFYGYNPFPQDHPLFTKAQKLKPALRVMSKIVSIQSLKKGEKVSYNETFRAKKNTKIAVIPFGYFEGLDRRLSNNFSVYIQGKEVKIAGRVCMNLTCLDIGNLDINIGDEVEIFSEKPEQKNSVQAMATQEKTISYEVLVKLQGDLRREVI